MSKAVLLSIRPEWCEKIASGEKTIEVRKTRPNLETPFKCYIYETYDKMYAGTGIWYPKEQFRFAHGCRKVIGEFVCDRIYELAPLNHAPDDVEQQACLTREEIVRYLKGVGCGWRISDLKIYDKPKDLSEFYMPGTLSNEDYLSTIYDGSGDPMRSSYASYLFTRQLRRPPQSWLYVEELT